MSIERKALYVTIVFGVVDVVFQVLDFTNPGDIIRIVSIILSTAMIFILIALCSKYVRLLYDYEFIKYLFFGSKYNGFNFFPKLKLYMDYLGKRNDVEVETIEFECITDNISKTSDITWTMKNVYNKTKKEIKDYCLYTSSDFGTVEGVEIKVTKENDELDMDIDNIEKNYGVQKTPFTFVKPIKPGEKISQIKINMKMYNAFDFGHQEVVLLYPRNYGTKVNHMSVTYVTKGMECLNIKLHEIKRKRRGYIDEPLRACVPKKMVKK